MRNLLNFAQLYAQCNLKISTKFFSFILYQKDALKTRLKFTVMNCIPQQPAATSGSGQTHKTTILCLLGHTDIDFVSKAFFSSTVFALSGINNSLNVQ